jgi:predicted aspartyl protease
MNFRGLLPAGASLSVVAQKEHPHTSGPARHPQRVRIPNARLLCGVTFLLYLVLFSADPRVFAGISYPKDDDFSRQAEKAFRSGDYERSARIFLELVNKDAGDIRARVGASLANFKLQNYSLCFEQAAEALKLDPNNARAHALTGLALLRSGYLNTSITELLLALKLNPKEPLAYGGIAEIDYYENRVKESRIRSHYAFTLDSSESDYLITYARACSRLEMFREAADAYEQFLRIAPKTDAEKRDRIHGLVLFYRSLAGLRLHQISGPRSTTISFKLGSDRRPYVQVRVNGHDAIFVIDTGSGFTVISNESARKLGLSAIARGGTSQGVGGNGKFPIVYGLIGSLAVGDFRIESVPCFIRPFHGAQESPGSETADGFIGLSVLSSFLTQIDYKESSFRLTRNGEDSMLANTISPDATVVPFRTTQNGLISIETDLDGSHHINAILDSGASSSVISTAAVKRLELDESKIKGQTVQVIGAAGITNNVELLLIRNCQVANFQESNLRALILDFAAINETSGFEQSGILGGDFLRHFRLTIDFTHAQIALEPQTAAIIRSQLPPKAVKEEN